MAEIRFTFTLAPIAIPIFADRPTGDWQTFAYQNQFIPFTLITDRENPMFLDVLQAVCNEEGVPPHAVKAVVVLIKYLNEYKC